ncbi:nucleoside triphosphate pyrophosphohydrolase family protein [Gallibacterium melopsittaci]|uniref:Nucleoside triphosphate pyrophosphohydrolase family protein n=1 Tax=Gallibacterium melopsittaci TaxID=516063 RepID=A0ABV6HYI8_9PAST
MEKQNELQRTLDWFKEAKPHPELKDLSVQIGCHFEEVVEMLDALGHSEMAHNLEILANSYKQNKQVERLTQLTHEHKVEVLDSLADQVVTATGVAYMAGFDFSSAFAEVNDSN